ncbi:DUF5915 domain-containing protein [Nocardioides sp. TF02-7]|uniref:DUF5915 domain-containing protein n=1 Tax=Nocardioides sp. TF02-7 TaxID=2917724 RepID=UPI001F05ABDD|nr:DUF5915 domain-containing protein [Nocardioides sp. TF02-7]UMG91762.1 DUF5915 domain-containing protein [Nocardioides sp. TF02-7]
MLDTVVTPDLAAEGLARDLVRAVQQLRRDSGLQVVDRIELTVGGGPAVQEAARAFEDLIAKETLATAYEVVGAGAGTEVVVGEGERAVVALRKA